MFSQLQRHATGAKICKAAALIAPHAAASGMSQADATQQDVNKNHRLAWRGNEAGNEFEQQKHKQQQQQQQPLQLHWQNEAIGNYQLTQQIFH